MRLPASTTSMKVRRPSTLSIMRSAIRDPHGRDLMLLLRAQERQSRGPLPTETATDVGQGLTLSESFKEILLWLA